MESKKRVPIEHCQFYLICIAHALSHLHNKRIIYRDLKPENILLHKDGYAILADFGLAKQLDTADYANSYCGTPEYLCKNANPSPGDDSRQWTRPDARLVVSRHFVVRNVGGHPAVLRPQPRQDARTHPEGQDLLAQPGEARRAGAGRGEGPHPESNAFNCSCSTATRTRDWAGRAARRSSPTPSSRARTSRASSTNRSRRPTSRQPSRWPLATSRR